MLGLGLAGFQEAVATVKLPPCYSDNMVLQRDVPTKICGYADPNEEVTVSLGNQVVGKTKGAGPEALWTVVLPVLKAGPVADITIRGTNTLTLKNLLAGDVWICAGQSNMEMSVQYGPWCHYGGVLNVEKELADAANHSQIRLCITSPTNSWEICSAETVGRFSASGYFFGRELEHQLNVPIGLIQTAIGGTPVEIWIPRPAWPNYARSRAEADKIMQELKPIRDAERQETNAYSSALAEAKMHNTPPPAKPAAKLTPEQASQYQHAVYVDDVAKGFDGRVKPVTVFPVKGVIWYQGESNQDWPGEYAERLAWMISGWRQAWGQADLPFVIMQLANFAGGHDFPGIREAQQAVVGMVPHTAIATAIDIGDAGNIHPKNKQEAGRRMALSALRQFYGQKVLAAGPKPTSFSFSGGKVVVAFDQTITLKAGKETGFEIAGKDGTYQPAEARAEQQTLTLRANAVPDPVAVRYAWQNNPTTSVFNPEGLPALPFKKGEEAFPKPTGAALPSQNAQKPGTSAKDREAQLHSDGTGWQFSPAPIVDPSRPRVLLVGDSILGGYLKVVRARLQGKANVDAWPNPYWQSEQMNRSLAEVLDKGPYEVVHINTGLHGWGKGRIKEGTFEPLTKDMIEVIRRKCPKAKVIWASSTPVTTKAPAPVALNPEINPIIVDQNQRAEKVMADLNVPVNDFYALLVNRLNLARGDQFHWTPPAYDILGKACADSIEKALK